MPSFTQPPQAHLNLHLRLQYAPPGKYFSGPEKDLLLAAADFCLVPSRFEPCGLVDIEFGWSGAVMIGHDTGGLGKMPGVYFTVDTSAVGHLAAKLAAAVVKVRGWGQGGMDGCGIS